MTLGVVENALDDLVSRDGLHIEHVTYDGTVGADAADVLDRDICALSEAVRRHKRPSAVLVARLRNLDHEVHKRVRGAQVTSLKLNGLAHGGTVHDASDTVKAE